MGYEHIIAKPKKTAEAFVEATQRLIDACLNDTEIVYAESPLDKPVEPLTSLDQRAYGEVIDGPH